MAPKLPPVLTVSGIRGRDGISAPHLVADDQCIEAYNVEFTEGGIGKKRNGVAAHGTTGLASNTLCHLFRHIPGVDRTAAEFWTLTLGGVWQRLAAGTAWATVTPSPADTFVVDTDATPASTATFNGKLFIAANSNVNRLHVWDGTTLRRVGLAPPAGASDALSAGAVTDVRKYKAAVTVEVSSVVVRRSELSPASGAVTLAGQRATLTLVTAPSEGETHWELYAASDDDNYNAYRYVGRAAIGSTIEDNTNDITAYATAPSSAEGEFAPLAGRNQLPPSCKFLVTDGNRLLMAGAYESAASTAQTTPKNNRVWFTPALGTTGDAYADDERVSHTTAFKGWVDVGENDGDTVTGLGVLGGIVFVFKNERLYRLRPTSDPIVPYLTEEVSKGIGSPAHRSIVPAEDENGRQCLYFWSLRGPYRVTADGQLEYIGRDIEDLTSGITPVTWKQTWALYYGARQQVLFGLTSVNPVGSGELVVFSTQMYDSARGRGGWSRWTAPSSFCGALFSATPGASMSLDLKPWIVTLSDGLRKFDTGTYDGQAYFRFRVLAPTQFRENFTVRPPTIIAETSSGVTLQGILRGDFHASTDASDTVLLTAGTQLASGAQAAAGSETRVVKRFDALTLSGVRCVELQVGDDTAVSSAWTLDSLTVPYEVAL
jgi:hypothetical protein